MELSFYKYHGTGNDFILIDNRENTYSYLSENQVALLCNRRFGIGADGLILLQNHKSYDFEMKYFNSDGKEATMCGNGGRCIVAFAAKLGLFVDKTRFLASDGEHKALITSDGIVELEMQNVEEINDIIAGHFLNTGSPHYVCFVNDINNVDVFSEGKRIRNLIEHFADGTNVNFVESRGGLIKVRTYERGVEDETLSCGTGVVASALAAYKKGVISKNSIAINTKGGNLSVRFKFKDDGKYSFENIWLSGPAKFVYSGSINCI